MAISQCLYEPRRVSLASTAHFEDIFSRHLHSISDIELGETCESILAGQPR